MTSEREYLFYLQDMEDSMRHIFEFTQGLDFQSFKKNRLVVDAVIRNFEIIGEASKNVPDNIKSKFPNIPWKNMYKLRNIISHDYFGIDYEVVWKIITGYLPDNYTELCLVIEIEKQNLQN